MLKYTELQHGNHYFIVIYSKIYTETYKKISPIFQLNLTPPWLCDLNT